MNVKTTTSVGEIAISKGYLTREQLEEAMLMHTVASRRNPRATMGSVLIDLGYLNQGQLVEVEQRQREIMEGQVQDDLPAEVQDAVKVPANRIGKFVRLELLGQGGLGEVWKAYDLVLRRMVAIKFVTSLQDDHWKMFRREAELLGRLQHPNIVPVYEIGDRFLVMPYIRGKTLDQAELSRQGAVEALRQVAMAIHHAHESGILHRDIKPSNIMIEGTIGKDFHVWVMDFGIAKEIHSKETLQTTGMIMGTPAYMAPEQLRGWTQAVGVRSDIYSLGATLYQTLTGRLPFVQEDIYELMRSIVEDEPQVAEDLPRDLRAVLLKAMDKVPEGRYATAAELAEDLARFAKGEPVMARPVGWLRRTGRRVARARGLAAIMVVGLFGIAFGVYGLTRNPDQPVSPNMGANAKEDRPQEAPGGKEQKPISEQHMQSDLLANKSRQNSYVGNLDNAILNATAAVQKDPKNPLAYFNRGKLQFELEQYDEAKKDFEECVRLNKGYEPQVAPYLKKIQDQTGKQEYQQAEPQEKKVKK